MKVLRKIITAVLLSFFIFAAPSTAEIKSIKIRSDNRPMILFQKFGFTHIGNITISVSTASVTSLLSQPDASRLGFFLLSEELMSQVELELQNDPSLCILYSKYITLLFSFRDLSPPPHSSFHKSYHITNYPDEYSLFFANCNPQSFVSMDVRIEMFNNNINNVDRSINKDYLPHGLTHLPSLYFVFSLVYLCFLGVWIFACLKNKRSVHQVHLLMGWLLIMRVLSLFCAAENQHYVKVTGTPHGWNILYHIFQFITSVLSFTLIVLTGAGWPNLEPVLQGKEKKVLMTVIPLQLLANVASTVIGETGPFIEDWVTWNLLFLLTDIICCCVVIFSVLWSIRSFPKSDGNLKILDAKVFCLMVISYFFFTRIGIFALKTIVGYENQWACIAADGMASLVLYFVMCYMLRPVEEDEEDFVINDEGDYEKAPGMAKV